MKPNKDISFFLPTNKSVGVKNVCLVNQGEQATTPKVTNLNGQLWKQYDESGKIESVAFDFKGNLLSKKQQVIGSTVLKTALDNYETFIVDWTGFPSILDSSIFQTDMAYDALNRVVTITLPQDLDAERKEIKPTYNRAGTLEKVDLYSPIGGTTNYVENIAYNAKGQRLLIAFGNSIMTRYAYDNRTFRLLRQRSEKYAKNQSGNSITYTPQSGVNGFTRNYAYNNGKNTLQKIENATPVTIENYTYDNCGNTLNTNLNRHYNWNYADQLICYKNQNGASDPTIFAQYDYSGQERVSKLVRTGSSANPIYERTIYIDGIFEYHILENGTTYEKNYIHIMDDKSRIAMVWVGTAFPDDITDAITYNLEDQIGSSCVRLNTNGTVIDKEEYYPFGDSSLRTFTKKRYRYVGKEKDLESGLYYYGARYYAAWTCRFISVDPLSSKYAQLSPYNYADNNPINDFDIDGMQNNNTKPVPTEGNKNSTVSGVGDKKPEVADATYVKPIIVIDLHTISMPIISNGKRGDTNDLKNKEQDKSDNLSSFARKQLDHLINSEGGYVDNPVDPGGKTKYGIAEKREWKQAAEFLKIDSNPENIQKLTQEQAEKYYIHSRFEKFRITDIKNEKIANAIFDQSVITPGIINKNAKSALNSLGYKFEVNSKQLSDEQIKAINEVNADNFVKSFTSKQLTYYESIKKSNPKNYNKHIDGWTNRLNKLNNYKP